MWDLSGNRPNLTRSMVCYTGPSGKSLKLLEKQLAFSINTCHVICWHICLSLCSDLPVMPHRTLIGPNRFALATSGLYEAWPNRMWTCKIRMVSQVKGPPAIREHPPPELFLFSHCSLCDLFRAVPTPPPRKVFPPKISRSLSPIYARQSLERFYPCRGYKCILRYTKWSATGADIKKVVGEGT